MLDGEWELVYGSTVLSMGLVAPGSIFFTEEPTIGPAEFVVDDAQRARQDGLNMGEDFILGPTITFALGLNGSSEAHALALGAIVRKAWRADYVRSTPGRLATLRTRNAGREREVYGRPRRCAPSGEYRKQGYYAMLADFQMTDDVWYDTNLKQVVITSVAGVSGGFSFPASFPVSTTGYTERSENIVIGGELSTWPILRFNGPQSGVIVNPSYRVPSQFEIGLNGTLGVGESVTVDTRPGFRTVRHSGGASWAGKLTRGSRLEKANLDPGEYSSTLRGVDSSGSASVRVQWRDAYSNL